MKKILTVLIILLVASGLMWAEGKQESTEGAYEWQPKKPINLIVPWNAGGSTDRSARVTADIVSDELGVEIVVVNQGGGSGTVGTKSCLDAPHDGYTWTAGAVKDLGVYKVQGLLDTDLKDWNLYLNVAMPALVSVHPDSPYQDFGELLAAFKENPGKIKVATAGMNSSGHTAIEMIKKYTGIEYTHVTYDGGNPAVVATVGGECDVVPQLSVEEVDMIKAGKLRPLAVLADAPLEIAGYEGKVPSIKEWIPDFEAAPIYFGLFVPADVPAEVTASLDQIWEDVVIKSDKLKDWAANNAVVFDPAYGEMAFKKSFPMVQIDAWLKHDKGDTVMNPEDAGIPKP